MVMLIQYKICACETVNQVQCSITMMSSCYSCQHSGVTGVSEVDIYKFHLLNLL